MNIESINAMNPSYKNHAVKILNAKEFISEHNGIDWIMTIETKNSASWYIGSHTVKPMLHLGISKSYTVPTMKRPYAWDWREHSIGNQEYSRGQLDGISSFDIFISTDKGRTSLHHYLNQNTDE